jgi:hypothetical protein
MTHPHHLIDTPPLRHAVHVILASAVLGATALGAAALATAQDNGSGKKLFCWNENGRKVCSDALPPGAVDRQRVEINQTSGTAVRAVSRALTEQEREQQALAAKAAETEAERLRREMAMAQTFSTEADLERSFRIRFDLLDESLKSSAISIKNLRQGLLNDLRQANEIELENKPIGKRTIDKIRTRQLELRQLLTQQQRQTQERAELDLQFQSALLRYRELKQSMLNNGATPTMPAVAPTPSPGG